MSTQPSLAARLQLDAGEPSLLTLLAECGYFAYQAGESEQALVLFQGLGALTPDDPTAHLGEAEVRLARGEHRAAREAARRARERRHAEPQSMALAYLLEAQSELELGRYAVAEELAHAAADVGGAHCDAERISAVVAVARARAGKSTDQKGTMS
jgi:predicted Zn-dependent protease